MMPISGSLRLCGLWNTRQYIEEIANHLRRNGYQDASAERIRLIQYKSSSREPTFLSFREINHELVELDHVHSGNTIHV